MRVCVRGSEEIWRLGCGVGRDHDWIVVGPARIGRLQLRDVNMAKGNEQMNDDASVWRKEKDFEKHNQHYVPQFWQRQFKDANGKLYARYSLSADPRNSRDPDRGRAFDETTKNTFTDDHTYTVSNGLFQPRDVLENLLSAQEGADEAVA